MVRDDGAVCYVKNIGNSGVPTGVLAVTRRGWCKAASPGAAGLWYVNRWC